MTWSGNLDWRSGDIASWLCERGSLTARCERNSRSFRVEVLGSGHQPALNGAGRRSVVFSRDVLLRCDGVAVIYAHTELPRVPRGCLHAWLKRLGSRSLGSLLFTKPGFVRGPLEFRRLDRRDALFGRAVRAAGISGINHLWARRCRHRLGDQSVLVTEVFLPELLLLKPRAG